MAFNHNVFVKDENVGKNSVDAVSGHEIYCICRSSNINAFMISCDYCQEWYHGECIGVNEYEAKNIDLYCCKSCEDSNPNLKTTYKIKNQRKKKHRRYKKKRRLQNEVSERQNASSEAIKKHNASESCTKSKEASFIRMGDRHGQTMDDAELASIFQVDTTHRKAKLIANENLKHCQNEHYGEIPHEKIKPKEEKYSNLQQCYGPECINAARVNSKYCSDECGIRLGRNRILEILPNRIEQRKIIPCAADEASRHKLAVVRQEQKNIHKRLVQIDMKIAQLLQLILRLKNSREDMIIEDDSDEESIIVDCKLCGGEFSIRVIVKHMESCYKKQERRLLLTGTSTKSDDEEWNIFCNQKMGRQGQCKQLRVLCPFHTKESKDENEPCGYPISLNLSRGEGKFCGRTNKSCNSHPSSWESIFRAELDLEKFKLLMRLAELEKEEKQLRNEMANRGNLMALLLHHTIVH
ncbi:CXXC-type zinc finger protein 1 [Caerostris darwini]|uniref:CXXC-type zinc finger protein 1 n=1 Tax=Caerostris darwini TaxID=1538125 RepID=A0AAV4VNA9_9ARAC|nr:CXXC-type zinc finger protein 1 [Caerostris darwini]